MTTVYKYPQGKLDKLYDLPATVTLFSANGVRYTMFRYISRSIPSIRNAGLNSNRLINIVAKNNGSFGAYGPLGNSNYCKKIFIDRNLRTDTYLITSTSLREITIGPNVTTGSFSTFTSCPKIETVYVDSQYVVDNFVKFFPQITSSTAPLQTVYIGDNVKSIGTNAFLSASSIKEMYISDNVETMSYHSIGYSSDGGGAYYKLNIPQKVKILSGLTFEHCVNYDEYMIFPETLTDSTINASTWYVYSKFIINANITSFYFPYTRTLDIQFTKNTLQTLSTSYSYYIRNLTLPSSLQSISIGNNMQRLVSLVFEGNCPTVNENIIQGNTPTTLKVYYYEGTTGWGDTFGSASTQKVFRGERTVGNYTYKFINGINNTPNVSVRAANNVKLSGVLDVPQTVTIDNVVYTVRYIAEHGFENQYNITSFDMNSQYLEIGEFAFKGCRNLSTVSNTQKIEYLGESAFEGCSKLTSFSLSNADSYAQFIFRIKKNTFKDCISLTSCSINITTREIYESAFENCESLASFAIPNTCRLIHNNAFKNCKSLQTVTYGESLVRIYDEAFMNCEKLQSFTNSSTNNLITLKNKVFMNCVKLQQAPLTSIKDIGKYCFYNCTSLTSITLPATSDYIDDYAFANCNNLSTFTNNTPNNVEYGDSVFLNTNISI